MGILSGDNHERFRHGVGLLSTVTRPSFITSRRADCVFRRGAVQFIGQNHVGEDRPFPKLELVRLLVEMVTPGFRGEQIAGELNPLE